jgi:hypothetical protein
MVAMITTLVIAAYRAKDAGRRPWMWTLLAFVPVSMIFLGLFPSVDDEERKRLNDQISVRCGFAQRNTAQAKFGRAGDILTARPKYWRLNITTFRRTLMGIEED